VNELPTPLTPSECDLRDFPFMPLDVVRLRDSDISALSNGDEFRCAVLLWCASWHQVPAASLPDDDKILCQLAGFGRVVKEWQKVREGSLRGWVKCSDSRLYHPVVAEKAIEAWNSRVKYREAKEQDRQRKAEERARRKAEEQARHEAEMRKLSGGQDANVQRTNAENPQENALIGTVDRDSGQGQGELNTSVPIGTGAEAPGAQAEKPADDMTKVELWRAGKSLLKEQGMPAAQCGTFVGKLCKDYTDEIVIEAVRAAVVAQPADAASFLKAACMARKNEGGKTLIPWHATDAGVIAKGAELVPPLSPIPGEKMIVFKARVIAAIDKVNKPPEPMPAPSIVPAEPVAPARQLATPEVKAARSAALRAAAAPK
jgi:hypothetical protein